VVISFFAATGCVLPVHMVEPASGAMYGRVLRRDGRPAAAARVAVTSDYKDPTCAHAKERSMTDSAGVFRLRPTQSVRRWLMLIPPMEHFGNTYWVCAGTQDSLSVAYNGFAPAYDTSSVPRDTLTCQEWIWESRTHVTCAGRGDRALQSGGNWFDARGMGFYRLILVEPSALERRPAAYLQWIQRADSATEIVREMIALPMASRPQELNEARLWSRPIGACVSVRTTGLPERWYKSESKKRVALDLGPPGQFHEAESCGPD
jgi:hypothetical protein